MTQGERLVHMKVLMVDDELTAQTAWGRATRALAEELRNRDVVVVEATSDDDGQAVVMSDPSLESILLDWTLGDNDPEHDKARALISLIRGRNAHIPIFIITERDDVSTVTGEVMREADELISLLEDPTFFIAGRIVAAIHRYREVIVPTMTKALISFAQVYEYSWHTPGHAGGTAFLKSPAGRVFYDYFGENLLLSDLSIGAPDELGSLLGHSGPIGESEKYEARVFGADRSYSVTNGTSTSNRVVMMASVTRGDYALCDRNAHKSIEQALTLTGVIPTYLLTTRNHLGIIGPIHPERMTEKAVKASIAANPLAKDKAQKAVHAIVTNSTYDGLIYLVPRVVDLLDKSVDRIHFDEAWFGYARFNPIYKDRFGMYGDPKDYPRDKPTIFTVTSTHKLLAALSQSSLINVRDGRKPVEHGRFNEAFMMHASTSPLYAIIASNEISAAMMDGVGGLTLTTESISEAVAFRKALCRTYRDVMAKGDWMFKTWNADEVTDPATGKKFAFADAPDELLITNADCWVLHPGQAWHGFKDLEDGYCMLDPIKVSVVAPGVANDGSLEKMGIPAMLVADYLDQRGVYLEKTTDFTMLFLFSIGVTKGKYGTLINALLHFKEDYDANAPLSEVLVAIAAATPERYAGMGLRDLSDEMFAQMKETNQLQIQDAAFSTLPVPVLTPADTYFKLVHDEVEQVAVDKMANRIVATGVVPYPPGIPMLMPGENVGADDSPYLGYLRALQAWDRRFPGFGHETHGVEDKDGTYYVYCLK
jgi:arginine/lysine/ornithine decarboxylase